MTLLNSDEFEILINKIDSAESEKIFSKYMEEVIRKGLASLKEGSSEESSLEHQIKTCNDVIEYLSKTTGENQILDYRIHINAEQLMAIWDKQKNSIKKRPETSIALSHLFTGNKFEPQMVDELKNEILSSDKIDLLVSFIKWSGLRLIINELNLHCQTKPLRVITTTYTGATDLKAIMELAKLPNTDIKISYDAESSRLHAKSYIFTRETGFSTAYIGSSNLSSSAISGGLEWNVKITQKDLPHILDSVNVSFESTWNDPKFVTFFSNDEEKLRRALKEERCGRSENELLFDIQPFEFQKDILNQLQAERTIHGRYRNLIVAATGTGKTVISAFDYKRFCESNPGKPNRLLFVAHRREILKQSMFRFRGVLRDNNFGELFDGINKPTNIDHVFMSIQTFNSQRMIEKIEPDYYDFIIVDETHHGSAPSYQDLLTYFKPKILLGLTATPERMDGFDIKEYFENVIASEIRLPEAIDRNLLVPFQYFGVSDNVDLSSIKFEHGRYDIAGLNAVYVNNKSRALSIIDAVNRYVTKMDDVIGLGFCASKEHAHFMAGAFNEAGINSLALTDESKEEERNEAASKLENGELKFIFTVDLYNEGVDIPKVNTVLFLRPTESMTVFLQQLGRGLRVAPGKDVLTVLDFIGQANKQYSFEKKFQVLTDIGYKSIYSQIESQFSGLPQGCYIQLEKVARENILQNIKNAINNKNNIIQKLKLYYNETGGKISLEKFLNYYDLEPRDIYAKCSFTKMCLDAGIPVSGFDPSNDHIYSEAFLRLSHIDSRRWITALKEILSNDIGQLDSNQDKMALMLYYNFGLSFTREQGYTNSLDFINFFKKNKEYCDELIHLLNYKYDKIKFVDEPVNLGFDTTLDLFCTYSRDEILTGLGKNKIDHKHELREGAYYFEEKDLDIFFINLKKSDKEFSPTTMYEDYIISDLLFHWQSQNKTSSTSSVGLRYITQRKNGGKVLLFVRECKSRDNITEPYFFLGRANYESHQGSKPISIVWRLERPIPPHIMEKLRTT